MCFYLSKMNKAVREARILGCRDEEIKEMMEEGRWPSASCRLRIIQQKHSEGGGRHSREGLRLQPGVEQESEVAGKAMITS